MVRAVLQNGKTPGVVILANVMKVVTPEIRHDKSYRPRGRAVWRVLDLEIEYINVQERRFFGFQEEQNYYPLEPKFPPGEG